MNYKNKNLTLTIIIENHVIKPKLKAEHGWSIIVEKDDQKILFDCGQSSQIISNANKLNINLNDLNKIVLSHGHYDHTGGLLSILKVIKNNIKVFANPDIFEKKYKVTKKKIKKYIGFPFNRNIYEKNRAKFVLGKKELNLGNDIYLTGQIERNNNFEKVENTFIKKENDIFIHDNINDDISMFIDLPKGLVLILGCAHSGIINVIEHIKNLTKKDNFLAIIGGFHLDGRNKKYIEKTLIELNKYKIKSIFPAHCTGLENYYRLKKIFGKNCHYGYTGRIIKLMY